MTRRGDDSDDPHKYAIMITMTLVCGLACDYAASAPASTDDWHPSHAAARPVIRRLEVLSPAEARSRVSEAPNLLRDRDSDIRRSPGSFF
jgi:hypothetical protein